MPAAAPYILPALGLGLGVYQTIQAGQNQRRALDAAKQPRLTPEQQALMRTEAEKMARSRLQARGLGDSSLLGGAYGKIAKGVAEASAPTSSAPLEAAYYANLATGQNQSAADIIGNIAQAYFIKKLFPQMAAGGAMSGIGGFGEMTSPTSLTLPSYAPNPYADLFMRYGTSGIYDYLPPDLLPGTTSPFG